jgi:hypothetical protein
MWQNNKIIELEEIIKQKDKDIADLKTIIESLTTMLEVTANQLQVKG